MSAPSFSTTIVRDSSDIAQAKPQFTRADREAAAPKEKLLLSSRATAGAEFKLSPVDFVKELSQKGSNSVLETNVAVDTFIENLERHCVRFDMHYFMCNFPKLDEPLSGAHDRFRNKKTVNLFQKWDVIGSKTSEKQLILSSIGENIAWLKTYTTAASESYLEDMEWVHQHLINSMSPELREDVLSTLKHDFPKSQHGGPLTFAVMIDKVINLSATAIDTLKQNLKNFNIKDVPGEDINFVHRLFLYAFQRLETNKAIDTLLIDSLYKVFQSTSVSEFNDQVAHMDRESKGSRGVSRSYKEILDECKEHYLRLVTLDLWTGVTPAEHDSAFNSQTHDISSSTAGSGITPPPGPSPYCAPVDADRISSNPERFQRVIKGRLLKYCAHCPRHRGSKKLGRWQPTHFSDEHTGGVSKGGSKDSTLSDKTNSKASTSTPEGGAHKKSSVSFNNALMDAQEHSQN